MKDTDTDTDEFVSKHFENFLSLLQFTKPKPQNFHQNNSCKFTKPQKKLHIYSKTTIGLSSRQCICNFDRSANIENPKLK